MNLELTEVIDNGDGSVFVGVEFDNEMYMGLLSIGLNHVLREALAECDTEDEEVDLTDLVDWSTEEVSETETKGE